MSKQSKKKISPKEPWVKKPWLLNYYFPPNGIRFSILM